MTPAELRRRARAFMASLGRADALAQLDQRSATDGTLHDAFARFRQRYAPGCGLDGMAFAEYADAFADAARTNIGAGWVRRGDALHCTLCPSAGPGTTTEVGRTHDATIAHALMVTHLVRVETASSRRRPA